MENDSIAADPSNQDSSSNKVESNDLSMENEGRLSRSEEVDEDGQRSARWLDKSMMLLPDNHEIVDEIDRFMDTLSFYLNNKNEKNHDHDHDHLPEIPDVVEIFVKMVQAEMDKYESTDNSPEAEKFGVDEEKDMKLTCMVGRIVRLTNLLSEASHDHKSVAPWLSKASLVLQRTMKFMEEELRRILEEFPGGNVVNPPEIKRRNSNPSFSGETPRTSSSSVPSFRHAARIHYHSGGSGGSNQNNNGPLPSYTHSRQGSASDSPMSDSINNEDENFPGVSDDDISQMRRIVVLMMTAGYESECCQVYSELRRNAFKFAMTKRGYEKVSAEDIQKMAWDLVEAYITRWVKVVKQTAKYLFPEEKKLCESVFQDYPSTSDGIMTRLVRGEILLFLSFADGVAGMKRSSERLFRILDVYESLTELIQAIEDEGVVIVCREKANDLKSEISCIRNKLGELVMSIFTELEDSIKADVARHPVPNGAVHPLTRYIMNYVRYTCDFKDLLDQVFYQSEDHHKDNQSSSSTTSFSSAGGGGLRAVAAAATGRRSFRSNDDDDSNQGGPSSPFGSELVRIMGMLDSNLEAKAKLYKDPSLRCIFLMNNGRYILQKIKESPEMRELVGNNSMRKRSAELRSHHKNYQRETWSRVLQCLNHEGIQVHGGKVHKQVLKERFKTFNNMFDDIRRVQSAWVVSDEQLQSELRVSISAVMIPAYRAFVAKFAQHFSSGRQTEKYVKYQPDDIETSINELFDGNPVSLARKKS